MDYHKMTEVEEDEAKECYKSLWRPVESECILKNLKKILNFLQSPAEEVCFVNMQEKYLLFYYMIILDDKFLQTTFQTDECKLVATEILHSWETNRNSFTWEVSFHRQIGAVSVVFKKLYTQSCEAYPRESLENPICSAFKEIWIKTTLEFIKSSRLVFKFPEMSKREAQYLYKGILKLNNEEIEPDSLWAPVWEALNIFKLRYKYIVSLHSTAFDYLKFVHFEKVTLRLNNIAIDERKPNEPLQFNESLLSNNDDSELLKNTIIPNELLFPVVDHDELIKTLLEMSITKFGTIVCTIKANEPNKATKSSTNELKKKVVQPSGKDYNTVVKEAVNSETQDINSSLSDGQLTDVSLTIVVQDEVNTENGKPMKLNEIKADAKKVGMSTEINISTDNTINLGTIKNDTVLNEYIFDLQCDQNKNVDFITSRANVLILESKLSSDVKNKHTDEDVKNNLSNKIEVNCVDIESEVTEPSKANVVMHNNNMDDVNKETHSLSEIPDTALGSINEMILSKTDDISSVNVNPFFQQLANVQHQKFTYVKEENFMSFEDVDDSRDTNYCQSDIFKSLFEKFRTKRNNTPPRSAKSQMRREAKLQRRCENKIRQKRKLVDSVPTKFIMKSFKAILDFIEDDLRASMEMVSLNNNEFNVLRKLHGFSPNVVPVGKVFHESCVDIVMQLFERLKEKKEYRLEINWLKSNKTKKKITISTDGTRQRTLVFTKRPFKNSRSTIDSHAKAEGSDEDEDLEEFKNPKPISEICSITPMKTALCPGKSIGFPENHNVLRSPSVSPARLNQSSAKHSKPRVTRNSKKKKSKALVGNEDFNDKLMRTPIAKTSDIAVVSMKAKLLEGLAVPLESDKAMRMMRLMGWKGGALGVRGEGLIEPIQPQLNVPRGVGLGHKMFKLSKSNINQLRKKGMCDNSVSVTAENGTFYIDSSKNTSNNNKNDKGCITNADEFDKSHMYKKDTKMNSIKTPLKNIFNSTSINEVETISPDKVLRDSGDNANTWNMVSKRETDGADKIDSECVTNECLLENSQDKNTATNVCDEAELKFNKETVCKANSEDSSGLRNESTSQEDLVKSIYSNAWRDEALVNTNIDTVRFNHDNLMSSFHNNVDYNDSYVSDDEDLQPYTVESEANYLLNRTQFLVHLLDLLQSNEKRFTRVSYGKKFNQACIEFINSTVCTLNRRQSPNPNLPRERRILEVCVREMKSHTTMILSCQFKKKSLTVVKIHDPSNTNPFVADVNSATQPCFETTHNVFGYFLCNEVTEGIRGFTRSKIITNRIILEFLKSDDEFRVYNYGKTSFEIRNYITSLISLLNRQMTEYQLALGKSEHSVFRDMLHEMKDFCLIFRFDTQSSYLRKLQLIKVDLTKRCSICQIADQWVNPSNLLDNSYIIDAEKVKIESSDYIECKSDKIDEKSTNFSKLCVEKVFENKPSKSDYSNEKSIFKQYLIAEGWTACDVDDKTYTKELHDKSNLDMKNCEKFVKEATVNNDTTINACNEEISSDFHNWPKRVKKNETNNNNLNNEDSTYNTIENYENISQNNPKRKVVIEQKPDEGSAGNVLKLNALDDVLTLDFNNSQKANKNNSNLDFDTEGKYTNIIKDCAPKLDTVDFEKSNLSMDVLNENKAKDSTRVKTKEKGRKAKAKSNNSNVKTSINSCDWPKNILVVHFNYPHCQIDANSAMLLQSTIYNAINNGQYLPSLKCYGLKNGGIIYTCYDQMSYVWLYKQLQWYTLMDYEHDLDITHIIKMRINTFIKVDVDIVLKNIERYYDDISTTSWKVVQTKVFRDHCVITIEVDDASLKKIRKEQYSLFVGVDKADICVVYDWIK